MSRTANPSSHYALGTYPWRLLIELYPPLLDAISVQDYCYLMVLSPVDHSEAIEYVTIDTAQSVLMRQYVRGSELSAHHISN
jgi:hypothetical protein